MQIGLLAHVPEEIQGGQYPRPEGVVFGFPERDAVDIEAFTVVFLEHADHQEAQCVIAQIPGQIGHADLRILPAFSTPDRLRGWRTCGLDVGAGAAPLQLSTIAEREEGQRRYQRFAVPRGLDRLWH